LSQALCRQRRFIRCQGWFAHCCQGMAAPQGICRLRPEEVDHRSWMQRINTFLFDIDGVIHNLGIEVPGAAAALNKLRAAGKKVLFMTNNATKTPEDIVALFDTFGAKASTDEVMTSAVATAEYLKSQNLHGKRVYVVGMNALANVIQERAGLETFGGEEEASKGREEVLSELVPGLDPPPETVGAVVVGADFRFNYYKLTRATNYLRANPDCLFVSTNPDPRALAGEIVIPASGVFAAAIAHAAGKHPDIVCGKPSSSLAQYLLDDRGLDPEATCMVGDRLDTDIAFGRSGGMHTLLVESGSMTAEELKNSLSDNMPLEYKPHFVAPSIAVLSDLL